MYNRQIKVKHSSIVITKWKLLTRLHSHCKYGGEAKYLTHVSHKFGGHPGLAYTIAISVHHRISSVLCSESDNTRLEIGNGRRFQNVGGRRHRIEGYGRPNIGKQGCSRKNQGKIISSFKFQRILIWIIYHQLIFSPPGVKVQAIIFIWREQAPKE